MKIAGVVVLYNPTEEIIENIKTYLPIIEKLYVMDNSTKPIEFLDKIKSFGKVEYISLNGNKGIALALKLGTEKAIEDKFDLLLSMDQDSKYPLEDFKYIQNFFKNEDLSNIGIVTINHSGNKLNEVTSDDKSNYIKIPICITSASIIVLNNYKKLMVIMQIYL